MGSILEVARSLGLRTDQLIPYGHDKAKIRGVGSGSDPRTDSRLVLVSAITPTPAGEGKTATAIGLSDAMAQRGRSVCLSLREPSMGPCMGLKGGGTGGGQARLIPSDDINLHFTGDFHAVTSAHNLLSAAIANHVHFGSELGLDPRRIRWRRVLDVNDRALRNVITGLGGPAMGSPTETGFDITAASELMAIVCLAEDHLDLRRRIDSILVGFTRQRRPVFAADLGVTGAMLALLRDAMHPNLVQTLHGTPALVHGGPFANIAHGCSSVAATKAALRLANWCVTEAGFGFDLGAEKFFDIKCRAAGLQPSVVVLVATARALKLHGGRPLDQLAQSDPAAVDRGLPNLAKHIENVQRFGTPLVVAINRFETDAPEELAVIESYCRGRGVAVAVTDHFARGPEGATELAALVEELGRPEPLPFEPLYSLSDPIPDKIRTIATTMYDAGAVEFTRAAERSLRDLERLGYGDLPVCVAKTQSSLSDDPQLRGRPSNHTVMVRELDVSAGAGFVVALTGDILTMPGLPRHPQAEHIDLVDGEIVGLR